MLFFLKLFIFIIRKTQLINLNFFKYFFIPLYYFFKKKIECPYSDFLDKNQDLLSEGNIIDAGANIGYMSNLFAKYISKKYKIYAFEPDIFNYNILTDAVKKKNNLIETINCAVGNRNGKILFYKNYSMPSQSCILNDKKIERKNINNRNICEVDIIKIDDFVEMKKINFVSFIKIDVEGYEYEVLEGAEKTIINNKNMILSVEYHPREGSAENFLNEKIIIFLQQYFKNIYFLTKKRGLSPILKFQEENIMNRYKYIDIICSNKNLISNDPSKIAAYK